jgi:hypothetical protein
MLMVDTLDECPLDRSRLVFLSGYGRNGIDLSVNYCPRCDVVFAFLASAGSQTPPDVLEWHRRDESLDLRPEDQPRWQRLPRDLRECWEANLRYHVGRFLRGRHLKRHACPMDGGGPISVLRRWRDETGTGWLLSWCRWCGMGFLFAFDPDYGWEHCANVTWDDRSQCYNLGSKYETGGGHAVGADLLNGLPRCPSL